MKQTQNKPVILMAKSDIGGRFAPTAHGVFETVGDAERFGQKHFKCLQWLVGRDTGRRRDNGVETDYEYLSPTYFPRRKNYGEEN